MVSASQCRNPQSMIVHMKKRIQTSVIILIFQSLTICSVQSQERQRLLIDADWRFSQSDTLNAHTAVFNDSKWRRLDLPHDWSIENEFIQNAPTGGGGGYLPTGIGWY